MKKSFIARHKIPVVIISVIIACILIGGSIIGLASYTAQQNKNNNALNSQTIITVPSESGTPKTDVVIEGITQTKQAFIAQGKYINIRNNDKGGFEYSFALNSDGINDVVVGKQYETEDYVYTYGYAWSPSQSSAVATLGSLTGWVAKTEADGSTGWGVAVKDQTQTTYQDVYTVLKEFPVLYMSYTFSNCTAMTQIPRISIRAVDTERLFNNCTGLNGIVLPDGLQVISQNTFNGCANLKYLYIPLSVTNINGSNAATAPCSNCDINLVLYCAASKAPLEWHYWNATNGGQIFFGQDIGRSLTSHFNITKEIMNAVIYDGYVLD